MSEAKEYLGRIQQTDKEINRKLEQLTTLNSMVMRITPVLKDSGGSGGTGGQDKLGNAVAKIADLQEEINRDVDIFVDMKLEACGILNRIKDDDYYDVLEMRYLKYMSFEQIAVEKNWSKRWAEIMNGRALQAFDKVLEEQRGRKTVKLDAHAIAKVIDERMRIDRAAYKKI